MSYYCFIIIFNVVEIVVVINIVRYEGINIFSDNIIIMMVIMSIM